MCWGGQGGLRPHAWCLPVLKRERHRRAVAEAATSGDACFFLGTDSAPHLRGAKVPPASTTTSFSALSHVCCGLCHVCCDSILPQMLANLVALGRPPSPAAISSGHVTFCIFKPAKSRFCGPLLQPRSPVCCLSLAATSTRDRLHTASSNNGIYLWLAQQHCLLS